MPKYRVSAIFTVSVFVGEFEAETEDEAKELAENSESFDSCPSLCWQCADVFDEPNFWEMTADKAEEN